MMNSSVSALPLSLVSNRAQASSPVQDNVRHTRPLPTPAVLRQRLPLSDLLAHQVSAQRQAVRDILHGDDPRLLVVVGPCSIHDADAALDYARHLADLAPEVADQMLLVMRAYIEKPRTTVGWKGLVYDPQLDGSGDMARGLELSRRLMLQMIELGLPLASELLQPLVAGYVDDLLGWAAIGPAPANRRSTGNWSSAWAWRWGSRTAPTAAWASPSMPCARRPPPISISAWTSWAVRRWSRPGATRTPTWCCVAATRGRTSTPPAWPPPGQRWIRPGWMPPSWSTAATPTAARTRCVNLRYCMK